MDSEVRELLDGITFLPRRGESRFGEKFAVELWSSDPVSSSVGDLHLRIIPLLPLESTDPEMLATHRAAYENLASDPSPGVAEIAGNELKRLDGAELPGDALAKHQLRLCQGQNELATETDTGGEARFQDIFLDAEATLHVDSPRDQFE